jgi:hypothetical protein
MLGPPGPVLGPVWCRHWTFVMVSADGVNWHVGRVVGVAANGRPVVRRRDPAALAAAAAGVPIPDQTYTRTCVHNCCGFAVERMQQMDIG